MSQARAREELVAAMYTAVRESLQEVCDALGFDGIDAPHVSDQIVSDFLADFGRLAGLLGYSRPRVVETIEELEGLPDATVIHNSGGKVGELDTVSGSRVIFWVGNECEDELIEPWVGLPATVLWVPEEAK